MLNLIPKEIKGEAYYYRYEDHSSSYNLRTSLYRFRVVKTTLRGVWIKLSYGEKDRFILNNARKRYAYPTKELAWESFKIRKAWRVMHLESQLNYARQIGSAVVNIKEPPNDHKDYGLYIRLRDDGDDIY